MNQAALEKNNLIAFLLRTGLGTVFVIGGLNKLTLLLSQSTHQGMVDNYMGTAGYINSFFQEWLFAGDWMSPATFLTALSTFELVSGIMLIAGILVRPLALIYGFLLWTFVIALPVMTVPGESISVKTYESPAILVQIRDIALSGFMFVLFNLGAGRWSLDNRWQQPNGDMTEALGVLLRLSLAGLLVVAGLFAGMPKIQSYATPGWILFVTGVLIMFGPMAVQRFAGALVVAIMLWFMVNKLSVDKTIIGNLNGFKREFATLTAGLIVVMYGAGVRYTLTDMVEKSRNYLLRYKVA